MKKEKSLNKSGSGALAIKKYVYADQLKFLNKIFCPRATENSLNINSANDYSETDTPEDGNGTMMINLKYHLKSNLALAKERWMMLNLKF